MQLTEERFWRFCLTSWEQSAIRSGALTLQDEFGLEPNLLLLALYLDQQQRYLTVQQYQSLQESIQSWLDRSLTPYRQLRQLGRSHLPPPQIEKMRAIELKMEQRCQKLLLQALTRQTPQREGDNLSAYLSANNLQLNQLPTRVADDLKAFIQAA